MYYLVGDCLYSSDVLCHHGVKGMKWGVRRYQNADGSYINAGLRRKHSDEQKRIRKERISAYKNRRTLSDADLDKRIARLKKEKEFAALTVDDAHPVLAKMKSASNSRLGQAVGKIAVAGLAGGIVLGGRYYISHSQGFKNALRKKMSDLSDEDFEKKYKDAIDMINAFILPNPNKKKG